MLAAAMARVFFTKNLDRYFDRPGGNASGVTVRQVLDSVFNENPRLRGYILDDQGAVRKHVCVFVNGQQIADRDRLADPVTEDAEVYVMQALSGG